MQVALCGAMGVGGCTPRGCGCGAVAGQAGVCGGGYAHGCGCAWAWPPGAVVHVYYREAMKKPPMEGGRGGVALSR
jgi:hypothetical protein